MAGTRSRAQKVLVAALEAPATALDDWIERASPPTCYPPSPAGSYRIERPGTPLSQQLGQTLGQRTNSKGQDLTAAACPLSVTLKSDPRLLAQRRRELLPNLQRRWLKVFVLLGASTCRPPSTATSKSATPPQALRLHQAYCRNPR